MWRTTTMHRRQFLAAGVAAALARPAWAEKEQAKDVKASQPTLVEGNKQFAVDLFGKLRAREGNLFLSPYSISSALAMTYAGARGDTAAEMAKALHFTLPDDRLHPAFAALTKELN